MIEWEGSILTYTSLMYNVQYLHTRKWNTIENISSENLLKYAIDNGMIDLSYVQEKIEMNKREEILKTGGSNCMDWIRKK